MLVKNCFIQIYGRKIVRFFPSSVKLAHLYKALLIYITLFGAQLEDGHTRGAETCCCYKWFNLLAPEFYI
jgi:hypothetical protein